jgi:hypothetical protein
MMAQITITIPDAIAPRVLNGFSSYYGYSPTLDNGDPNPETKAQFSKRKLIELIKLAVKEAEMQTAHNEAVTQVAQSVDTDVVLS